MARAAEAVARWRCGPDDALYELHVRGDLREAARRRVARVASVAHDARETNDALLVRDEERAATVTRARTDGAVARRDLVVAEERRDDR